MSSESESQSMSSEASRLSQLENRRSRMRRNTGSHDVTPGSNNSASRRPPNRQSTRPPLVDNPPFDLILTVVEASHVAIGDLHGSSDVYVIGKVKNGKGVVPNEPKSSRVHFRTSTCRNTRDPQWNERWRFGGVREGTYLKLKLYDEDPKSKLDDKLGSIKMVLKNFQRNLLDGKEHTRHIPIRAYKGKKHVQAYTAIFDLCNPEARKKYNGHSYVTVKLQLFPSQNASLHNIHLQTPTRYTVHSSPLVNLLATTPSKQQSTGKDPEKDTDFKAYKIALVHPPPYTTLQFDADISHSKSMDPSKLFSRVLRRLIRKQYENIYGHDAKTVYGGWWDPNNVGNGLVDLLQPIENKLFTFIISTDGEWRFCETGDEYKINHLSKHGMHADGESTVVWAGEFFVVRKDIDEKFEEENLSGSTRAPEYLICLDNDSGTYSPSEDKLADFKQFMAKNLRGVEVVVRNFKDEKVKEAKKLQKGTLENKDEEKQGLDRDSSPEGELSDEKKKNGSNEKENDVPRRLIEILKQESMERDKKEDAENAVKVQRQIDESKMQRRQDEDGWRIIKTPSSDGSKSLSSIL